MIVSQMPKGYYSLGEYKGLYPEYMQQERIWILLAKKLAGEISPEEFKELDDLLKKDPDAGIAEQIISALWKSEIPENKNAAEEAFTRLLQRKARKEQNLNSHFYNLKKKR